jgi:hypothetical protein
MADKRRTFFVRTPSYSHHIVLYSRVPGFWQTLDEDKFQYLGHAWLGEKGNRYRIEKWSAPHTDRTFTSLQSALNAWVRATRLPANEEKKTAAQLDAEIAETLAKEPR